MIYDTYKKCHTHVAKGSTLRIEAPVTTAQASPFLERLSQEKFEDLHKGKYKLICLALTSVSVAEGLRLKSERKKKTPKKNPN